VKKIIWVFVVVLLSGCAVGNKYDYRSSSIALPIKSTDHHELVLSVEDSRPYVLEGKKSANFVGLQRGGFGNPFDVTTASGKPLTEDMSAAITQALIDAGYQVVKVDGTADSGFLVNTATKNGATRILSLKVNEWKSDIYMSITLHCDLELKVFNSQGEMLAESNMKFVEEIGGAQIGGTKNSAAMTNEFAKRIGYLFNKQEIRSAL
jgi:hypothetical protein